MLIRGIWRFIWCKSTIIENFHCIVKNDSHGKLFNMSVKKTVAYLEILGILTTHMRGENFVYQIFNLIEIDNSSHWLR